MNNGYQTDLTQEERILKLLQERGESGAYVYEFMMPRNKGGLGIAQYNARIYGLRKKGYVIKNVEPGHFILEVSELKVNEEYDLPIFKIVEAPKLKQTSLDDIIAGLTKKL